MTIPMPRIGDEKIDQVSMEIISWQLMLLGKTQEEIKKKIDDLPEKYVTRREFEVRSGVVDKALLDVENDALNSKSTARANVGLIISGIALVITIIAINFPY